jgi:hypothetical protein
MTAVAGARPGRGVHHTRAVAAVASARPGCGVHHTRAVAVVSVACGVVGLRRLGAVARPGFAGATAGPGAADRSRPGSSR